MYRGPPLRHLKLLMWLHEACQMCQTPLFRQEEWCHPRPRQTNILPHVGVGKPQQTLWTIPWETSVDRRQRSHKMHGFGRSQMNPGVHCHSRSCWVCQSQRNRLILRRQRAWTPRRPLRFLMEMVPWDTHQRMEIQMGKNSKCASRIRSFTGSLFRVLTMLFR